MNTTPADPRNEHGDHGAFGWLAGDDEHPHRVAAEIQPAAESIEPHDSGRRLDSLAVNTLINRGLMIALCLIVVAVTFEGVKVLTTGGGQTTQIVPSAIEPATKSLSKTTKTTPTTKPRAVVPAVTTTTTQPVPATVPKTAPINTVPRNTTPITAPQQVVRATTPPQTAPAQPIVVPLSTPPTTAPHDTVQVPFTPGQ